MSEFELITITYSFVLGLGVAQILAALVAAVRSRLEHPLHWMPIAFAASIFMFHIQFWFVIFQFDIQFIDDWTWGTYAPLLFLAVLLFLAGGIILPRGGARTEGGLIADFDAHGRLGLLFLAAYLLCWIPLNGWAATLGIRDLTLTQFWTHPGFWLNLVLGVLLLAAYRQRDRSRQTVIALLYLAGQAYGFFFVWSSPMDVS